MKKRIRMIKKLLFSLVILAGILLALNLASAGDINSCTDLNTANTIYTLTGNVFSNGTCFNVTANNISLDGGGFMINYSINVSGYGILVNNFNLTIIKNSKIVQGKDIASSSAIYMNNSYNNTINNNTISTYGFMAYAVHLNSNSSYNLLQNNTIMTSGSSGYGFNLVSGNNFNTLSNNYINTSGDYGYGFSFSDNSKYNNMIGNTINTSGMWSRAIFSQQSSNFNTFRNNFIITSGMQADGFWFSESSDNTFINNTITTLYDSSYGLNLRINSDSNIFSNNTITTSGSTAYGILIYYDSKNNSFSKTNIFTNGNTAYPLNLLYGNTSLKFEDSIMNSSSYGVWGGSDVLINSDILSGAIMNFTNVTRSEGTPITFNWQGGLGLLNVHWYLNVNVSNTTTQVQNANVSLYDVNNNLKFSELSDSAGLIARKTLLEYFRNATASTFFTNYNLSVIKAGYNNYSNPNINLSVNRNIAVTLYAPDQEIPAQLTIHSPKNTTYYANQSIILRATAFNSNPQAIWYSNDSGKSNVSYTAGDSINLTHSVNGSYVIKFYANNSANNVTEYSTTISVVPLPPTYKFALNATTIYVNQSVTKIIVSYGIALKKVIVEENISTHVANIDFSQIMDDHSVDIGNYSVNLSRTTTYNHTLEMFPATIISGAETWDGSLELPIVNDSSFSISSGNINTVVTIGSSQALNLSKPAKITLGGMYGKNAAWSESNPTLTTISTYCNSLANPTNIDANTTRECYINAENGQDLVIWSYHLSNFVAYTPATTTTTSSGSGGGGTYKGKVYSLTEEQLKNGYKQFLGYDDKLEFILDNETYYIKIKEVNNYKAILTISNAIEVDLINNEERLLDFMVDGKRHILYLKVNYINSADKISLTIRKIVEKEVSKPISSITGMAVSDEAAEIKSLGWLTVIVIASTIIIVAFIILLKKIIKK